MGIAYVEHPVSKEEKKALRKEYDRVVDVRFAPADLGKDDKIIMKAKPKTAKPKAEKPKTEES